MTDPLEDALRHAYQEWMETAYTGAHGGQLAAQIRQLLRDRGAYVVTAEQLAEALPEALSDWIGILPEFALRDAEAILDAVARVPTQVPTEPEK